VPLFTALMAIIASTADCETLTGSFITIHLTPSLHGGVVSEPE
jgi:hypothetical protein